MKRRSKIFILALAALLLAGIIALLCRPKVQTPAANSDDFNLESDAVPIPHYAVVTSGAETPLVTHQAPDLSEKLKRAALRTVLATLPEGSAVQGKVQLRITGARSAQVTGEVLTPPGKQIPERRYNFQIELDFLPGGDAECAFPEFTELNQP